jgi:hypothetical protein
VLEAEHRYLFLKLYILILNVSKIIRTAGIARIHILNLHDYKRFLLAIREIHLLAKRPLPRVGLQKKNRM